MSRASFASLDERLAAEQVSSAAEATRLGDELFAVVGLLDDEHGLRRALSDPGKPAEEKGAVARELLHGKVSQRTENLVVAAVESRWATSGDMVDAVEELAVEAMVLAAEADNALDDLEDGLFRFGRVVAAQPDLRAALDSTWLPAERKRELLDALLHPGVEHGDGGRGRLRDPDHRHAAVPRVPPALRAERPGLAAGRAEQPPPRGKVTPVTLRLITQMVTLPRGRPLPVALDMCANIAARHREQLIAVVRSAVDLTAAQRGRLADALAASYRHRVHLNVVIDPSVMGGISVRIGDELIDGTVASRLATVRRKLAG